MDKLQAFVSEQLKKEVPEINVGDTVKVHDKIKEGNRERIQIFEGTVIAKKGGGISETYTVRRAKLYYLRDRVGKRSKVKEQIV